jgi:hypothetical protein
MIERIQQLRLHNFFKFSYFTLCICASQFCNGVRRLKKLWSHYYVLFEERRNTVSVSKIRRSLMVASAMHGPRPAIICGRAVAVAPLWELQLWDQGYGIVTRELYSSSSRRQNTN